MDTINTSGRITQPPALGGGGTGKGERETMNAPGRVTRTKPPLSLTRFDDSLYRQGSNDCARSCDSPFLASEGESIISCAREDLPACAACPIDWITHTHKHIYQSAVCVACSVVISLSFVSTFLPGLFRDCSACARVNVWTNNSFHWGEGGVQGKSSHTHKSFNLLEPDGDNVGIRTY